jgi:Holliday junction resolvase-like predicted endonuclease
MPDTRDEKLHALQQRHDIDAAGFEHGALGEIDLVQRHGGELVAHCRMRARQEARAHPPRHRAKPRSRLAGWICESSISSAASTSRRARIRRRKT